VPRVFIGEPVERDRYLTAEMDGIKIFYHPSVQIKAGFSEIQIKVRRFLFLAWLEIEGAKAIPVYSE
jgi:hypothetical protein